MDALVNAPVSRILFCTLPEDGVSFAASMMPGGGAWTTMRQWGCVAGKPAGGCFTVGACEAAAGRTGCVKMEVVSMMPGGGALSGGGQPWSVGAGGGGGGRLTTRVLKGDALAGTIRGMEVQSEGDAFGEGTSIGKGAGGASATHPIM
jgi:hypothetical protein